MSGTINTNLAKAEHNMKMSSKLAHFLQNQFTKKLICDLISQLIFKLSSTNYRLFQGDCNSVQYGQIILVFILKKLNVNTCGVTFYPSQKVVNSVKSGDFNIKTL